MPKSKADGPLDATSRELAAEIETLARLLSEQGLAEMPPDARGQLLAVSRMVSGLTPKAWGKLTEKHPLLGHWVALPVSGSAYPMLANLQERLNRLSYQSEHDPLTGLLNRRGFHHSLEREMQRAKREGFHMSLAMLDLDDFKIVNDTHGHACGDQVLKGLAQSLQKNKRSYDQAARLGGEEFALLLPSAGPNKAMAIMNRLMEAFAAIRFTCDDGQTFSVTFSAGVCHVRGKMTVAPTDFIAQADDALYEAKRKGKKTVVLAKGPDRSKAAKRTMVHSDEKRFLFSGSNTP